LSVTNLFVVYLAFVQFDLSTQYANLVVWARYFSGYEVFTTIARFLPVRI
ncbi:hypothetical protein EZS27_037675, partial [termite gut metagenome]